MESNSTQVLFIMGVSGCGKSTIGKLLSEELNIPFFDGDDYHPEANIEKMKKGIPLNDEDRFAWLIKLNQLAIVNQEDGAVIACSALKESYRELLKKNIEDKAVFVYLEGTFQEISDRLSKRSNHFMPPALLKSQFETLEPPEYGIKVSINQSVDKIVRLILNEHNVS
jgi:gluconokinase